LERVTQAGAAARGVLLGERTASGWWEGELSDSALSTAVAVLALGAEGSEAHRGLMASGLRWLARTQLADGGWGDTVRSKANVATTLLAWSAFGMGERSGLFQGMGDPAAVVARAEGWIVKEAGGLEVGALKAALGGGMGRIRRLRCRS